MITATVFYVGVIVGFLVGVVLTKLLQDRPEDPKAILKKSDLPIFLRQQAD